jgi:hypothetical protein
MHQTQKWTLEQVDPKKGLTTKQLVSHQETTDDPRKPMWSGAAENKRRAAQNVLGRLVVGGYLRRSITLKKLRRDRNQSQVYKLTKAGRAVVAESRKEI